MLRYPVFVVGSPRSGTSILVDALLSCGYWGFREGMFLSMVQHVDQLIDRHYSIYANGNNLISEIDKSRLRSEIFAVFKNLTEDNNKLAPWFDKTGNPDMILALPIIASLWPDSVFIFAKRRAIENVVSRLKKFPNHNFEYHCNDWTKNMAAWREIRKKLDSLRFIEIDQLDMIREPERSASQLRQFLQLPPERQQILLTTLRTNRPQQTANGTADRTYSLSSAGFSETQVATFLRSCKAEMDAFGYSVDENYRLLPAAEAAPARIKAAG